VDVGGRIAFRTAVIFGIRIRDQLGCEMVFSTMQPKCSPKEYFNKIGIEANIRFRRVRFRP